MRSRTSSADGRSAGFLFSMARTKRSSGGMQAKRRSSCIAASVSRMSIQDSSLGWLAWKEVSTREPDDTGLGFEDGLEPGLLVLGEVVGRINGSEPDRLCLVLRCLTKSPDFFLMVKVRRSKNIHPRE